MNASTRLVGLTCSVLILEPHDVQARLSSLASFAWLTTTAGAVCVVLEIVFVPDLTSRKLPFWLFVLFSL